MRPDGARTLACRLRRHALEPVAEGLPEIDEACPRTRRRPGAGVASSGSHPAGGMRLSVTSG
ncbi:MAG: hypothetical protein KIT69_03000 [Propionibacteriaceae bacterium]|nr:hypothetical protein [Propionibacteriaceae bacterium]